MHTNTLMPTQSEIEALIERDSNGLFSALTSVHRCVCVCVCDEMGGVETRAVTGPITMLKRGSVAIAHTQPSRHTHRHTHGLLTEKVTFIQEQEAERKKKKREKQ